MSSDAAAEDAVPVAIVGAGPVGLSLALGLARRGVRSVLVERNRSTSEHAKAPGVHIRTREMLAQWGVEDRFLTEGTLLPRTQVHDAASGRVLSEIDLRELDDEVDGPGLLMLEQSRTEALLLEAVRASGSCDVRFATEAVGLQQAADRVTLTVRHDEETTGLQAAYVVGCDGPGSFVRGALGLSFDGITYPMRAMLADVDVDDARDGLPAPRLRNARGRLTAAMPLRPGRWRIIGLEPGEPSDADEVPDAEVHERVAEVLGPGPTPVRWASRFRLHRRSAPTFRVGRVLLAGDAAHLHSPAGGQGMNAGMQDAHNLAWKLAAAIDGGDVDRLLDAYDVERRGVVVGNVSRYTDLVTRAGLQSPGAVRRGLFGLVGLTQRVPRLRRQGLRRFSMLDLDCPPSPLLDADDRAAGVRLPNVPLYAPGRPPTRLHRLVGEGPALLQVTDGRPDDPDVPIDHVIVIGAHGHRDPTGRLRRLLGGSDGWLLVRPDQHIAWARTRRGGLVDAARRALGQ